MDDRMPDITINCKNVQSECPLPNTLLDSDAQCVPYNIEINGNTRKYIIYAGFWNSAKLYKRACKICDACVLGQNTK